MSNDAIAGSELEVGRRKHLGTVINCLTLSASNVLPRPGCVERLPQECMSYWWEFYLAAMSFR